MATVCEVEGESKALQAFVEKRVANRTRQAATQAPAASDEDEPDPPKFKRSKGKHEGKKNGRSKAVVAEATRCRETYAVGNTAVLEDEEALKMRDILVSLASRRHVDADDDNFCKVFDAALMTGIHDHLWQCAVDGKIEIINDGRRGE
jgi:hypothetical protein